MTIETEHFFFFFFLVGWETLKLNTNKRGNKQFHARINVIQVEMTWPALTKKLMIYKTLYICIKLHKIKWLHIYVVNAKNLHFTHLTISLPKLLFRCLGTQFFISSYFFCRVHNSIMISWLLLYFLIYP